MAKNRNNKFRPKKVAAASKNADKRCSRGGPDLKMCRNTAGYKCCIGCPSRIR